MNRLLVRLTPLLLLVLAIGIPVSQTEAQGTCDWRLTYDFTTTNGGFAVDFGLGAWTSGAGWQTTAFGGGTAMVIYKTWPIDLTITGGHIVSTQTGGTGNHTTSMACCGGAQYWIQTTEINQTGTFSFGGLGMGGTYLADERLTINPSSGTVQGAVTITLTEFVLEGTGTGPAGSVACDEDPDPGPGGLTYPLRSADLHEDFGTYDDAYVHGLDNDWPLDETGRDPVYSYSRTLGAKVHAVESGTVTAVDFDIRSDCQTLQETGLPGAPDACFVVVPAVIRGEPGPQLFTLQMARTARVIVRTAGTPNAIYNYFVSNPSVSVGDVLTAGCILGEVMELNNAPYGASSASVDVGAQVGNDGTGVGASVSVEGGLGSIKTGEGVVVVRRSLLPDLESPPPEDPDPRLLPDLGQEPDETACGGNFGGCKNLNSSLLTLTNWITSDGVTLLAGGGVTLPSGTQIYQNGLVLDDATDYKLTLQARSTTPGDGFSVVNRIRLFVGENTLDDAITTTWVNYSMEFVGEDLASSDAFGVVNQNYTGTDIEIRYICISEAAAPQVTNACYFNNHHFDDGPDGWTITPGITFNSGQAFTYDESVIERIAVLDPIDDETPATYSLTIGARLLVNSLYTGQAGKYISLSYRYPMSGDYVLIDEIDSALVVGQGLNTFTGAIDTEHLYTLSASIEVSEHTNSLFSIQTLVEDPDNYMRGLRIDFICLQADTPDGSFPNPDAPGGFVPPFYENCEVIATPTDNNISSWTYYHWQNLRRFFDCTLMVRLNKMAEAMNSMFATGKLFMRWSVASVQYVAKWVSTQVIPWLNGSFRNMAIGQVTTIYEGSGTCSDFFCVLNSLITGVLEPINNIVNTLLGLLTTTANLLLTVLTGIIGLALSFVGRIFVIFNQATGLLTGLISAYNTATPVTIDGMPMCTVDPDSSMFCRMVWVMDNTAFSGRWGLLFSIALAILTIHLVLWAIGEFRRAIVSMSVSAA